jgi:chromosome segregation ATPase
MDKASIAHDLQKRGTMDLMKEVADDKYTPPADGKLTDAQVQMYLKVRDHEKQIAQVARAEAQKHADEAKKAGEHSISGMVESFKTMGAAAEMMTADVRAAKDLHYNTQEYLWVKGKVIEASVATWGEKTSQAMSASLDASYNQMKKQMDEAKDEQTKKMYADTLASMEKSRQEMAEQQKKDEKPELAYNKQLLSKYENALNALTAEAAKWEEKPGEAQKSMDDYQKGLQKAVDDAKKNQ